ncbi:hypothetical protein ACMYMJ_23870, partial [Salmonella enterica subsp. enterica serovar Enteritidis]|uniref:hypothetical protein n=1 Tax=Salmonella enterica TaxID=28901 RepID=UPI0039E848BA
QQQEGENESDQGDEGPQDDEVALDGVLDVQGASGAAQIRLTTLAFEHEAGNAFCDQTGVAARRFIFCCKTNTLPAIKMEALFAL